MKNATRTIVVLLLFLTLFPPLEAQTPDLVLHKEISPEYILYLAGKEAAYQAQVLSPLAGDDTPTMKAHMGLAILQLAWTHVNGDTLVNDLEYLFDDIDENAADILFQTLNDIVPILDAENPNEFVLNLTDFFESGIYEAYRDSMDTWLMNISSDFEDVGGALDHFGNRVDPLFEMFGDHWDAVAEGTADFEFFVQLMETEYEDTLFIFSREFFDRLDRIGMLGENMAETLESGFTQMFDSLNQNSANIDPGIAVIRNGLDSLYALVDSVQILLWNQPFAPFEFDLSGLDSLQELITEIDTLLAGKEYPFGPENENKTIRPRGLIESLAHHDGPWGVYQDYYRQGELATYTFGNTFPWGLTTDMYALIASDIILNANDSRAMFELKIHAYQALLNLKPVKTADEHFGIALTLIYDLLTDKEYFGNIEEALRFISEGRIDSLVFYYDWSSFDLQDQISEIRYHIDQYIESDDLTNYVILIKENFDGLGPYKIGPDSEFSIYSLTVPQVIMATEMIETAIDGMSMIADGITGIFDELSQIFDLDLNPEVLNFSNVESELDIILILEQSNPNFLTVTPYGIDKFHETGDRLEEAFEKIATFYDSLADLMNAIEPYQDDFDINASEMASMLEMFSEVTWELYSDFAYPDSTTWIEGERVNLSAWFDSPPGSFLMMWKAFVTGVDSTLGGLFPDRFKVNVIYELLVLPKQFKLYPVYPNPFNPVAKIEFDLPRAADVKLSIINLNGEAVSELINGHYKAGKIISTWNAGNFPSGIYFCRLSIDGTISTRKMTLMK